MNKLKQLYILSLLLLASFNCYSQNQAEGNRRNTVTTFNGMVIIDTASSIFCRDDSNTVKAAYPGFTLFGRTCYQNGIFYVHNGTGFISFGSGSGGGCTCPFLPLSGGTMAGTINMSSHDITNIGSINGALGVTITTGGANNLSLNPSSGGDVLLNTSSGGISQYNGNEIATINQIPSVIGYIKFTDTISRRIPTKTYVDSVAKRNLITYWGAVGGGASIHTAINAMISAGLRYAVIPEGVFNLTTTVTIPDSFMLVGSGDKSTIIITGSPAFTMGNFGTFRDFKIVGQGKNTGNTSESGFINATNASFFNTIENITGVGLGEALVYFSSNSSIQKTNSIINCKAYDCNKGYFMNVAAEYNEFIGCVAYSCNTGIEIYASGNNKVVGGHYDNGGTGIYVHGAGSGFNDGHSVFSGVTINHNTVYGLNAHKMSFGYDFVGCEFHANDVFADTSDLINFQSCRFNTLTLTANGLTNSKLVNSLYQGLVTITNNSGSGFLQLEADYGSSTKAGYIKPVDWSRFDIKQDALNGTGFVKISGTTVSYDNSTYVPISRTVNGHPLSANVTVTPNDVLPTQTGNSGKFLTTDGTNSSWATTGGGGGSVNSVSGTTNRIAISGTATDPVVDVDPNYGGQTSINTLGAINRSTSIGIGTAGTASVGKFQVVETGSTSTRGINSDQYSNDVNGSRITMRKARNTFASPATVNTLDNLGSFTVQGHDGTNFMSSGRMIVTAVGTISTGIVPGMMRLQTADATGVLTDGISFDQNQDVTMGSYTTGVAHFNSVGLITSSEVTGTDIGAGAVDLTTQVAGLLPNANIAHPSFILNGASIALGGTRTLSLASSDFINQGTATTVLHGNGSGNPAFTQVTNSDLAGSIAYGKLSLTGAILNADLAGGIAYSKLSLTGAVINADLAGGIDLTSKVTGTLPVTNGGIGVASTTAYAVLCGGTTSTGALQQVSGLGTSGYVLTSNGVSALPTWQANTAGVTTVGSFNNTSTGNGLDISGSAIALHAADGTNPGAVTTGTQTIAGAKTLTSPITDLKTGATGNTNYDGLALSNTTTASSGNQMYSPSLHFIGQGWKTNSTAASQTVETWETLIPTQSTGNPGFLLNTDYSINGGTRTNMTSVANDFFQYGSDVSGGGIYSNQASTSGDAVYHGIYVARTSGTLIGGIRASWGGATFDIGVFNGGGWPLQFYTANAIRGVILPTGEWGIGNSSPNSKLQITGSVAFSYIAKTANYTITASDYLVNCTANSFTITLPTAVGITGRKYIIKNTGTATIITIATTSSQTIDGAVPATITSMTPMHVMSDGANWITW